MHHNGADDTNIFFVLFSKKSVGRLTKFGEILPLWHNVKNFGHFEWVDLLFGKCHLVMLTSTKFSDT